MKKPTYKALSTLYDGFIRVKDYQGKLGIIDNEGNIIVPLVCDYIGEYHVINPNIIYIWIGKKLVYMDLQGNLYTRDNKLLSCEKCPCYNDKLISGFCCKFKVDL